MSEIAKTIYAQLMNTTTADNKSGNYAAACWGARDWSSSSDGKTLNFKVNGGKHKGYVGITLNDSDLYDIEFFTIRRKGFEIVKKTVEKLTDVCWVDLARLVDGTVESDKF